MTLYVSSSGAGGDLSEVDIDTLNEINAIITDADLISVSSFNTHTGSSDIHHTENHSNRHEADGDDQLYLDDLAHQETVDGKLLMTNADGTAHMSFFTHGDLTAVTSDQHHTQSHNHDVASGAGAIATDQIAKFGDGGTTDYCEIQTDGKFRAYGDARFLKNMPIPPQMTSTIGSATFNSVATEDSGLSLVGLTDRTMIVRTFDSGAASGTAENLLFNIGLPQDYVAGTDLTMNLFWCAAATSGDVRWQVGTTAVDPDGSIDVAATYTTPVVASPSTTSYGKKVTTITIDGTSFTGGQCLGIVLFRDADNVADDMSGDALLMGMCMQYVSDKLGADLP